MAAQIIMVASGKGGTGKSTFSVLLGAALARRGDCVMLLEVDAGMRSIDVIAGVTEETVYDLGDVLGGRCEPEKALVNSELYPGLFLLCAPYKKTRIDLDRFISFVQAARTSVDVIIMDMPPGIGGILAAGTACLQEGDVAVLVATPNLAATRGAAAVANAISQNEKAQLRLVVNQVQKTIGAGLSSLDDMIDDVGAQLLGVLPYEECVPLAVDGKPLPPTSLVGRAVENVARRLCKEYVPLLID